jgi:hypothetical protein
MGANGCSTPTGPRFHRAGNDWRGRLQSPNPLTAAPSIVGMSLAMKGPETMTSTA